MGSPAPAGGSSRGGWISGCGRDRLREASEPEQQEQGARGRRLGAARSGMHSPRAGRSIRSKDLAMGRTRSGRPRSQVANSIVRGSGLYSLSYRYQTIHVLQIQDSGSFVELWYRDDAILDARHCKLYLENKFKDGTWEYEDLGSYFSDGELDISAAVIFNRDHIDTPCVKIFSMPSLGSGIAPTRCPRHTSPQLIICKRYPLQF